MAAGLAFFLMLSNVLAMFTAFEAQVINVTAQIEPCIEFETRSRGFWKNHEDLWILPQTLGNDVIETPEEARAVLGVEGGTMTEKLRAQLLTMKFNIAYFGISADALVPGETTTVHDLAAEADHALAQDPPPSDEDLENIKDRVERVNVVERVSTCRQCPDGKLAVTDWEYLANGEREFDDLRNNVNESDHLKVTFDIGRGCNDMEVTFASYKAPDGDYDEGNRNNQELFDYDTGFFDPGEHTMEIDVPPCFFQVDFATGPVVFEFDETHNYNGRLLDFDFDGENACIDPLGDGGEPPPEELQGSVIEILGGGENILGAPASSDGENSSNSGQDQTVPPLDSAPAADGVNDESDQPAVETTPPETQDGADISEPAPPEEPTDNSAGSGEILDPEALPDDSAEEPPPENSVGE